MPKNNEYTRLKIKLEMLDENSGKTLILMKNGLN